MSLKRGQEPELIALTYFSAFFYNTYFEFWATAESPGFMGVCSDLDRGGMKEIKNYARGMRVIFEIDM